MYAPRRLWPSRGGLHFLYEHTHTVDMGIICLWGPANLDDSDISCNSLHGDVMRFSVVAGEVDKPTVCACAIHNKCNRARAHACNYADPYMHT